MRADSCSGPTTDSICGHGLGRMGHSSNFARWPHLGPIPPMDGGGHLVPLSYVYGYRGGVGRRGVAQDTIGDNGLEIRARVRRYQLILSRCAAGFVPKSAISEISRSGQRKNGRSGENFLSTAGCAWAVLGGIPSGWGQFGVVEARPNRNALRRRKEHTRGDTDSRPARRQVPLVHGCAGTVPTNSGSRGAPPPSSKP